MAGVLTLVAQPHPGFELTVVDLDPLRAAICAVREIDLAAREDLAGVLQQQEDAGRRFIWLDLSQVTFLDCSCLSVLVAAHHRFLARHGLLVLSGVNETVARVLKITGLEDTLFIVADQDPFGSFVTAGTFRRGRSPEQGVAVVVSFDALMAAADQVQPESDQTPRPHSSHPSTATHDFAPSATPRRKAVS